MNVNLSILECLLCRIFAAVHTCTNGTEIKRKGGTIDYVLYLYLLIDFNWYFMLKKIPKPIANKPFAFFENVENIEVLNTFSDRINIFSQVVRRKSQIFFCSFFQLLFSLSREFKFSDVIIYLVTQISKFSEYNFIPRDSRAALTLFYICNVR